MSSLCFIQLLGIDGETIEGTASIYSDGGELPQGKLCVRRSNDTKEVIMNIIDMPQHWQDEIKSWNDWGSKHLD
jgi:hypothetical protein